VPAMVRGFKYVQPRLDLMVAEVRQLCLRLAAAGAGGTRVAVHCKRGGMRSLCFGWFLVQAGFEVVVLAGGYKGFKRWARNLWGAPLPSPTKDHDVKGEGKKRRKGGHGQDDDDDDDDPFDAVYEVRATLPTSTNTTLNTPLTPNGSSINGSSSSSSGSSGTSPIRSDSGPRICIVGGRTGSGKTRVLHHLRDHLGEQVLDLEGLANHAGSAFGWVKQQAQPPSELFQNLVAVQVCVRLLTHSLTHSRTHPLDHPLDA
jgi:hypothetical protein